MKFALLLLLALPAAAQYMIGTMYRPLAIQTPDDIDVCSRTWYDPDVHLEPNGIDLGVLAQSSGISACAEGAIDAIRSATRDGHTGAWTTPAFNGCATLQGRYTRCGFDPFTKAGPLASPSVVRLPNANSATGFRYYMAFVGGNADFIHGKIYWAVSDDGEAWTVYARGATEYWAPIIYSRYERSADAPRSTPACEAPSGIGQVQLAFEDGRFYMFFQYWHPTQPECADGHDSPSCRASSFQGYNRGLSSALYRFDYDPNHPFGFGPSVREMYLDGVWRRHSGRLVWRYDVDANGAQLPADADTPVLELYNGVQAAGFGFGAGDVKFGNGRWQHVYVFEHYTRAQSTTSLDPTIATWTQPEIVDTSSITDAYPLATSDPAPGIWYGALSGTPEKWWMWIPVSTSNLRCGTPQRPNTFAGLSLVPAVLCTPDKPC